jgi:hypothetical protein
MNILAILDKLEATPSTNDKLEFLRENSNNETLKEVFRLTYSTQIRFWIKKRPEVIPSEDEEQIEFSMALELLQKNIATRTLTGNRAIKYVSGLLSLLDVDDREVLYRVLDRDLKCGTGTSLANKVWKNLIPDYPVLLCNKFNEKTEKKIDWSIGQILQTKMDSSRINFEFDQGKIVSISTRNGSIIDITHFEDIILTDHDHFILDGELMYSLDGIDVDRKMSSGIINKAIKGTISKKEAEGLNLVCWDFIPYECFVEGECKIIYSARFEEVRSIVKDCNRIRTVESKVVYSKEEALEQYNENLSNGLEGCILKNPYAGWSSKRSNDYLKMKNESTADLIVIGYDMGTPGTQFEGMLGSLICETWDGLLQVNVGSGFKHLKGERDDPKSYIGKIIEVKYNEVISSKNSDKKSLFLPIFSCVREDKNEANTLEELL